jgi:rSAM/selenodomain-associated transferase 1
MDRQLVIVFARAPRYGAVKTRLAREIGASDALRFHKTTLDRLLRTIGRDRRWQTIVALTPDPAARQNAVTWPHRVAQGHGDLGQRMVRALRKTGARRPTIIIGSDIPDITTARISSAFRALGRAPYVLGSAADGGYWLIGARHPERMQPNTLTNLRWSTSHARADTIARLRPENVALLPFELEDIDDADAYHRWRRRSK